MGSPLHLRGVGSREIAVPIDLAHPALADEREDFVTSTRVLGEMAIE